MNLRGVTAGALAAGFAAYAAVRYRRWHLRWGATDGELTLALPGDELVERPHFNFTRAITIQARPEGSGPGWSRSAMAGPAGTATTRWTTWAGPAPNSSSPSCSSSRWATGSRWVASPGRPRPCA